MMRGSAWLVPLVPALLVLNAATAAAAYDVGSHLTADDPIRLTGPGSAEVIEGLAAFVGATATSTGVSLTADEAWVTHAQLSSGCAQDIPFTPCQPTTPSLSEDARHLRDVRIQVTGASGPFKIVASNDPADLENARPRQGAVVAAIGGQSSVTVTDAPRYLTPYQGDWSTSNPEVEPVYEVPAGVPAVATGGNNNLAADGDFHALLQGFKLRVQGTENGRPFDKEYDARVGSNGEIRFLTVETRGGKLHANSAQPLVAYKVDVVKVLDGGAAQFQNADGRVSVDGAGTDYAGSDVRLAGPLALRDPTPAEGDRIRVAISSDLAAPEEPAQLQQLAAAAAAGAGGAGLLAAAAYFWPRLKYAATLAVLPLYTRIERSQVLDHAKRDEIYELIRQTPGIHAHEIGERARIGWGTTVYHLKMLESHSLVVSKKTGRYKRFYVNTGEYTKKKDVYAALRNDTAKKVAEYVFHHPGTSQKEMCEALGIQPSLASWHVEKLEAVGLVKRVKDGRQVRYFAGPAWAELNTAVPAAAEGGDGAAQA